MVCRMGWLRCWFRRVPRRRLQALEQVSSPPFGHSSGRKHGGISGFHFCSLVIPLMYGHFHLPAILMSPDVVEVPCRRLVYGITCHGSGRHADHRAWANAGLQPIYHCHMIVAMQHQFAATGHQNFLQCCCIGQSLAYLGKARQGWMVDHQYTEKTLLPQHLQLIGNIAKLDWTQCAARFSVGLRGGAVGPDDGDIPAQPDKREYHTMGSFVVLHPWREIRQTVLFCYMDIGVMIAWRHRELRRRTESFQPCRSRRRLIPSRNVDEIAGESHVVGFGRQNTVAHGIGHLRQMPVFAVQMPGQGTNQALSREMAKYRTLWQRAEMYV